MKEIGGFVSLQLRRMILMKGFLTMNEIMMLIVFGIAFLFAVLGILLLTVRTRYKPPRAKRVKLAEFSKRTIAALTVMWFVGALIGMLVVAVQTVRGDYNVALSDLLLYIGAPMTGGIVTYMLKSAYENREKIKRSGTKPQEEENYE